MCTDVNRHIKYINAYIRAHTHKQEEKNTHTHITEIQIESERRPRSREKVFNSIKQNYRAGWRGVTFNGLMFEYKNFFDIIHDLHFNVIIHVSLIVCILDSLKQQLIIFFSCKSSKIQNAFFFCLQSIRESWCIVLWWFIKFQWADGQCVVATLLNKNTWSNNPCLTAGNRKCQRK